MNHPNTVAGIDLGDQYSHYCLIEGDSRSPALQARVRTTEPGLRRVFGKLPACRVALEVGPHSPWVQRVLEDCGHEVIVANARKLRMIFKDDRKCDQLDAEKLARVARLDPELLSPIRHRSAKTHADRALLRSRDVLVRFRARLVNHIRGVVKATGSRLPPGTTRTFARRSLDEIPEDLRPALTPLLAEIETIGARIRALDKQIHRMCREDYPETQILRQVTGVGPITALDYVLTIEDPSRFKRSRSVGAYVGLCPRRRQSGAKDPTLSITKAGDSELRRLLVQSAQYILGPFGPDCDLRRYGDRLIARAGPGAKKRAIIAVARKLAVLLHRLWVSGTPYIPLREEEAVHATAS